jgi:nucleotidyltransferase substrate binding protein (TIGR01987 family)
MSEIDFDALRRATDRLREAIVERQRVPSNDFVRDSIVQRFEFTYELSTALLRRFLKEYKVKQGDVYDMTFPSLIRAGSEYGMLLHGWDRWFDYRKARNSTSHAYDEERAKSVVELAPAFLEEAEYLYKRLIEEVTL